MWDDYVMLNAKLYYAILCCGFSDFALLWYNTLVQWLGSVNRLKAKSHRKSILKWNNFFPLIFLPINIELKMASGAEFVFFFH